MRRPLAESPGLMAQLFEFIGNHPLLVGLFVILLVLFIRNEMQRGGKTLSPQELVNLVNRENALVVDVREPKEYEAGHIVGAVNIPYAQLERRVGELTKHKSKPIAVVCRMGQNAGAAGALLRKHGFERIARLSGGMAEWRNQNLPVIKG
jgi:rhodanese-related sulfurtransferase